MNEVHTTITTDKKPALVALVRRLPAILSGRTPDVAGIAHGFRTRIGFAFLSLIGPNFDLLGRGGVGADGTKWPPLSKEYLAYGRRFGPGEKTALKEAQGLDRSHRYGPGDKKGLLTKDQLQMWRRIFADRYAWYVMREADDKAKAHAAAVAWIILKQKGAKTKLEVYGNRQVQILVDTGYLRQSLQPGTISEQGVDAAYSPPGGNGGMRQILETDTPYQIVLGTNVEYARHHHNPKSPSRKRRLWPERFPEAWWKEILNTAVTGLMRISELYDGSRGL